MEDKKTGFIAWVKVHKKQLILAGISVTTLIGIVIGIKNKDDIMDLWSSLENSIMKVPKKLPETLGMEPVASSSLKEAISVRTYTSPQKAFDVSQHIRALPAGRHHSAEKAAEAIALGISLLPNQTLVDAYTKCAA